MVLCAKPLSLQPRQAKERPARPASPFHEAARAAAVWCSRPGAGGRVRNQTPAFLLGPWVFMSKHINSLFFSVLFSASISPPPEVQAWGITLHQAEDRPQAVRFCPSHYSECITCVTQSFSSRLRSEAFGSCCNNNPVSLQHAALLLC